MQKRLSESKIKSLAGDTIFLRGTEYFKNGAIFNAVVQGHDLRAECEGRHDTYRVFVAFDKNNVKNISCNCRYSRGSRMCKHLVALLLAWVNNPSKFRSVDTLDKILQRRSKEELIDMIGTLVDRRPELLDMIEMTSPKSDKGDSPNPETYRRFVRLAWKQEPWEISLELDKVSEIPQKLAKNGNWTSAGNIFNVFLDECVSLYDPSYDEEGDVAISVDAIALGLARCLAKVNDRVARKNWLQTLLKAELKDVELGGIDLVPSASDALVRHATMEEWAVLEQQIRAEISQADDWGRESLENLLDKRGKKYKKTGKN